jgi:hypothetical protein
MRAATLLPGVVTLLALIAAGCDDPGPQPETAKAPEVKKVPAGKNVTVEIQGEKRRVLIDAKVCMRDGQLEQFLTRKGTKEHEAVLAADVDARDIHKALLACKALAGSPVEFDPKYKPASGTVIKVSVQWEEKGKLRTEPAQKWVTHGMSKKDLVHDWVFAGSRFVQHPEPGKPDLYLANDGDLICVSNFPSALLDLPVNSPSFDPDRVYVTNTDRIPPRDTPVVVILEPVPDAKKPEKNGR